MKSRIALVEMLFNEYLKQFHRTQVLIPNSQPFWDSIHFMELIHNKTVIELKVIRVTPENFFRHSFIVV